MTYDQFIERTDQLLAALSTCALTYQDAKFDYFSAKLDRHYADNAEHYQRMLEGRRNGVTYYTQKMTVEQTQEKFGGTLTDYQAALYTERHNCE